MNCNAPIQVNSADPGFTAGRPQRPPRYADDRGIHISRVVAIPLIGGRRAQSGALGVVAELKAMLTAIANAIHDATGVRIRRVPFRDARMLAALKAVSATRLRC